MCGTGEVGAGCGGKESASFHGNVLFSAVLCEFLCFVNSFVSSMPLSIADSSSASSSTARFRTTTTMTGDPVASVLYFRMLSGKKAKAGSCDGTDADDDEKVGHDDTHDASSSADDDTTQLDLGSREIRGCQGDIISIGYHTRQYAATAARVAKVHAVRYHHLDGCTKVYSNKASIEPDAPLNVVRCPTSLVLLSSPFSSSLSPLPSSLSSRL
jgi:hypothetical protein